MTILLDKQYVCTISSIIRSIITESMSWIKLTRYKAFFQFHVSFYFSLFQISLYLLPRKCDYFLNLLIILKVISQVLSHQLTFYFVL